MTDVNVSELGAVVLEDHEGQAHRLDSFWQDGPAVVNFLRHFG